MKVTLKILAFVIISCSLGNAQQSFPDSWLGKYKDNTISDGEEIPEVNSYLVNGRQKAVLRKFE